MHTILKLIKGKGLIRNSKRKKIEYYIAHIMIAPRYNGISSSKIT